MLGEERNGLRGRDYKGVGWQGRWMQGQEKGSTPTTKGRESDLKSSLAVWPRQGGYGLPETVVLKGQEERAKPLNEMAQAACPGKAPSTEPFIKVSSLPLLPAWNASDGGLQIEEIRAWLLRGICFPGRMKRVSYSTR